MRRLGETLSGSRPCASRTRFISRTTAASRVTRRSSFVSESGSQALRARGWRGERLRVRPGIACLGTKSAVPGWQTSLERGRRGCGATCPCRSRCVAVAVHVAVVGPVVVPVVVCAGAGSTGGRSGRAGCGVVGAGVVVAPGAVGAGLRRGLGRRSSSASGCLVSTSASSCEASSSSVSGCGRGSAAECACGACVTSAFGTVVAV